MHRRLSFCAAILALALLAGCGAPAVQANSNPATNPTPTPLATQAVPTPEPTLEPTPTPEPTPEPLPWPVYEFGTPVEESDPVEDDSFFDSAVFLGDSRTEGLQLFSGLKHGTFYWARGMSVFRVDDDDYKIFEVDGKKCTMIGALGKRSYDSVYIMIGVNELGYPASSYEKTLASLIDEVLAAQPDAVVYLQVMPPLNDAMCRTHGLASYINNDNLTKFNEAIVRVATEKKVALLNTAEVYTGEDGQLPQEMASDGCHFAVSGYTPWADYMRTHVMDRERYFYSRENA